MNATSVTAARVVHTDLDSPIGRLQLYARDAGLVRCHRRRATTFEDSGPRPHQAGAAAEHLENARVQLDEYFAGGRREFSLPLDLAGAGLAPADARILLGLRRATGYGATVAYGALATRIGPLQLGISNSPAQRIGAAMAANPLLILLPCHRVVGANGALTGYAAGLSAKRYLLSLEAGQPAMDLPLAGAAESRR